jgi:hypothetical protein
MNVRRIVSMRVMHSSLLRLKSGPSRLLRGLPPAKLNRVLSWAAGLQVGLMNAWTAVEELRKPKKIND